MGESSSQSAMYVVKFFRAPKMTIILMENCTENMKKTEQTPCSALTEISLSLIIKR